MNVEDVEKIRLWAEDLGGVFTMPDLKVLFRSQSEAALYKKLAALIKANVLIKIKRGLYAFPTASLEVISQRINPSSYISTGTVLARSMIIGSVPLRRVQAVKVGAPRVYTCDLGTVEHLSISARCYFGFELQEGVNYACPEKAFLDACYFSFKGKKFSFDLDRDVNRAALDAALLSDCLERYDRRFIAYYERIWGR